MLADLADRYGFDGYLINIETQFSNTRIAELLISFIESLKAKLHTDNLKNEIIWYDSYIFPYNKTYYVNGVNELNYNFFLAADRFFTNYWWNIKSLQENIKGVGMLGVQKKLYVGYDVWGRGSTIGKGGFDTSLACQLISKYKSNVALFSPAWTYEQLGPRNFVQNDTRFWVGQFEGEFSVSSSIKPHCSPVFKINDSSFTFYSNFGNGQGQNFNCKGVRVYNYPWVDGNLQWYLPLAINRDQTLGLQMHLDTKESFHGGSCLQVSYVPYLEEKSQGSAGYRVFSEQQVRRLLLFDLEKECYFNTIGVKLSYKLPENPEEVFKLSIKYRVQKKTSKATLVSKTGYLVVPLCSTGGSWFTLDNAFSVETEIQETIVLESIEVGYNNDNMGRSSDTSSLFRSYIVEDSVVTSVIDNEQYEKVVDQDIYHDDEKEGWVVIPRPNSISDSTMSGSTMPENSLPVLKVGEIAIINASNYPSSNFFELTPVTKVRRMATDEDGILFTWDRSKNNYVLYYVIYINDRFRGTSQTPQFFARKEDIAAVDSIDTLFEKATNRSVRAATLGGDGFSLNIAKIRVDIIDKLGTVFPGSELYI
ncbi:DEKNAAC100077 [Brettanomyces naardenensis]|uniref:DEKNAAC100077 n=1 Tax=Brettanomyces naardenensis TaxID=13370 RepID=A0A448YEY5_BRENA|nr:DEKNAAC100077 [Brettanomyces naardenensis]